MRGAPVGLLTSATWFIVACLTAQVSLARGLRLGAAPHPTPAGVEELQLVGRISQAFRLPRWEAGQLDEVRRQLSRQLTTSVAQKAVAAGKHVAVL